MVNAKFETDSGKKREFTGLYLNSLMKEIERYRDEYIKRNMKELIREMVGTGEDRDGD